MRSLKIVHWGGLAAIVSGLLNIVNGMTILFGPPPGAGTPLDFAYETSYGGAAAASLVTLLAIRAIHLHSEHGYGLLGKIGFFLAFLGAGLLTVKTFLVLILMMGGFEVPFIIWPLFMVPASVGMLVGPVLLGIAILRARVMPSWFGWLFTLSVPLVLVTNVQGYGAFTGGLISIVLGYALWAGRTTKTATLVSSTE